MQIWPMSVSFYLYCCKRSDGPETSVCYVHFVHFETLLQSMDRGQSAVWEMMKEKRLDRVNE